MALGLLGIDTSGARQCSNLTLGPYVDSSCLNAECSEARVMLKDLLESASLKRNQLADATTPSAVRSALATCQSFMTSSTVSTCSVSSLEFWSIAID